MANCKNCGKKLFIDRMYCFDCGHNQKLDIEEHESENKRPGHVIPREKVSLGKLVLMWALSILGGIIGLALASRIVGAKYSDGTPRYCNSDRTQAKIALIIGICICAALLYFGTTIV